MWKGQNLARRHGAYGFSSLDRETRVWKGQISRSAARTEFPLFDDGTSLSRAPAPPARLGAAIQIARDRLDFGKGGAHEHDLAQALKHGRGVC